MGILNDAAELISQRLGDELQNLTLERLVIGLFFTGVKLSNGQGGVCYTPVKEIPEAVCCPSSAGRIFNPVKSDHIKAQELISSFPSHEPIKTAVAIATLNALSATCWAHGPKETYEIQKNMDAQDAVRMPEGNSVAVVGALVPTLRVLKARGGTWWVIEKDPTTLKEDEKAHYVSTENSDEIIRRADILIITGATLVTHTLENILHVAGPKTEVAVMGPTAGFLPEPLFERGVRVVGGVWVKEPDRLLDVLAAGGSGYHFFDTLADRIVIEKEDV